MDSGSTGKASSNDYLPIYLWENPEIKLENPNKGF